MTSIANGHFAGKHPKGTTIQPELQKEVQNSLINNRITCKAAHEVASKLGIAAADVGVAIDLLDARISACQLGLFGHGPGRKTVAAAETVAPELKAAIEAGLIDGRLTCAQAWHIADMAAIPRIAVADACEALNIRISRCQIGAF
jgi:hypothetical protein